MEDKTKLILVGTFILFVFGVLMFVVIKNNKESYEQDKSNCINNLEGRITNDMGSGLGFTCYDTDEDGYRFYWKEDLKGNWYKER